ncbi:hypothetical protein LW133_07330, partial [Helicobacter sp. faydin-H8]|nr:hypothetical protein [Helicobacter anatolicus]
MFNVINAGDQSKVNIVVQGQVNVGANITYGGRFDENNNYIWDGKDNANQTTFIFANGNDISAMKDGVKEGNSGKDSFANSTDTTNANSKVLGVTYQDGIKLTLKDKTITNSNGENISFLNTYKNYFISKETDPILTLTTNRTNNGTFKDTIVIEGLLVGDVVALERSSANKEKHAEFDVTLKTNSAFFGGFDFSNLLKTQNGANSLDKTSITLVMEKGSKFFIDSSVTLQNLSIKNVDLNREETLINTFAQSNTVIDLGSYGNDNNALRKRREDFNLLSIGVVSKTEPDSGAQSTETTTGLDGQNALFRVYVNANADQNNATLGKINAKNASDGNGESGTYGHVYSDRIIVDNAKTNGLQEYIQVLYDADTDAKSLSHKTGKGTETEGNIAVFTVKNGDTNNTPLVKLDTIAVLQGFDIFQTYLASQITDRNGKVTSTMETSSNTSYTTYFVDHLDVRVSPANQQS